MANKETKETKNLKMIADLLKGDLANRVELEKEELLEGLMFLAKGTFHLERRLGYDGKEHMERVYDKLPDKDIARYLLDQFIGKPKQNVEVTGDPDKPLVVQVAPEVAAKYNLTPDATPSAGDNSSGQPQV